MFGEALGDGKANDGFESLDLGGVHANFLGVGKGLFGPEAGVFDGGEVDLFDVDRAFGED